MNSKQKEFDIVVNHLFTQGRPALKTDGKCAYRGENNTSCAVGCRIPNSRYNPKMDNLDDGGVYNVRALVREFGHRLRKELGAYGQMYFALQAVHDTRIVRKADGTFDKDKLSEQLSNVARCHGVVFTRPQ